jgi:AbrB family looped-hinge helix DNA binding protein
MAIQKEGKHLFGLVKVGQRGQIVIPKKARELFGIKPGDSMMVLGDENTPFPGIAIIKNDVYVKIIQRIMASSDASEQEKDFVRDILDAQKRGNAE